MGRKKFLNNFTEKKKLSLHQKMRIKSRCLNRTLMFSQQNIDELVDKYDEENSQFADLSESLNTKLALSDQKQENQSEIANKIQRKKDIRDNIFAVRNQTKSIKDSPIKVRSLPNLTSNLSSSTSSAIDQSKKEANDISSQSKNQIKNQIKNQNKIKTTKIRTNDDLYSETIAKQLRVKDSSLIRFIVKIIGASLAFKFSSKIFNDESIACLLNDNLIQNDHDDKPIDKFLQSIMKEKNISENKKQLILDVKFTNDPSKFSKKKLKKINKISVASIQNELDKFSLSLDNSDAIKKDAVQKVVKKFDFK